MLRDRLIALAVAALSGALFALCFGRESSLWLGWVALVPFVVLLADPHSSQRGAFLLGLVHGFFFWLIGIHWIPSTIHIFGAIPLPLAWFLFSLLAVYLGLFKALFAMASARLIRHGGAVALLSVPAVWVVTEWLYSHAVGGFNFPWNLAAYAWVDVPGALPLAAWIGPWGVSYVVLAINVALALAWRERRPLAGVTAVLSTLLLLTFAGRFSGGAGFKDTALGKLPGQGRPVRLVQPNQTLRETDPVEIRRQYNQILTQTRAECVRNEPTLIIWPESAAFPYTWDRSQELRQDLGDVAARGCSIVFNTPTAALSPTGEEVHYNAALLIESVPPERADTLPGIRAVPTGRYYKRFLVPYGEFVPFGDIFPFIDKLARFSGRLERGDEPGLIEWHDELLGLAICYEVIFPGGVAEQVRAGATLLVNISNDAWYGDSSALRQLFRAARFRAAENRRPMLRAALTGISGVIDARGAVRQHLGYSERDVLREQVRGSAEELTPYTRAPWLVPLLSAILSVLGLFLSRRNPT